MSTTTAIDKISEYGRSGTNRQEMGDLVFWRLDTVRVDRQTLLHLWKQAGLNEGLLPEEATHEKALKTAVQESSVGLRDVIVDKSLENEHRIIFAVIRKQRNGQGDVTTTQEAKITLDREDKKNKKAAGISLDTHGHGLGEKIIQTYHTLLSTHTADDIRKAITNAIHSMAAVTLRESGGVYWIPQPYSVTIRALAKSVSQIGHSRMYLLPISAAIDSDEAQGLEELAQGSLELELAGLKEQIEKYVAEPPARLSTLSNRLDEFKELRSRAQLYKMVLSTEVSGLEANIEKLEKTVNEMIEQKMAGK